MREKRNLVGDVADRLRERIYAVEPGALLGSLQELARAMGVGIVTFQQAARVLEHEGLLEARRGPGGGYYGARPDDASLERALGAYMRINPASYEEALDMTSLLFTELATAAAACDDPKLREELRALGETIGDRTTVLDFGAFELEFQELLFRMVRRPLFEMLTRVTLRYAAVRTGPPVHALELDADSWRAGRSRIIAAILGCDPPLARFEAERSNRAVILQHLKEARG